MDLQIRKLTPELAEDYVHFFDTTPHDDNVEEHKCYCICWCNDDCEGRDFSTAEKRRAYALKYVKGKHLQGYLAYSNNRVVGWCNANTKSDCLKCESWRRFMDYVPVEESGMGIKVKSIFCFVISPELQRKGIATQLLEVVCDDALRDGFDLVEAYPSKESSDRSSDFKGHFEMYRKSGFHMFLETEQGIVMRRQLK